ncbi:putative RIBOSOMAL RNA METHYLTRANSFERASE [Encephalitozoon cuniculi GB-M1]|uniref:RIBOSOMAL RNA METHYLTRANSFERASE n=1 Tax=Encephalitozoon cuniculi (strain GB-M1) TaxID=284813 RepID=Q8SQN1_ENCCU|nr:putative RIBOSOMAL RNA METHYLTRANSFERASE [Encephalitozoon cuniculi GB-M1]CAD27065.1 putative RIBOSOMAL RNA METHYLTRANSFERASE [Encephalitozoon cuniculi GB-M1]
MDGEEKRDVYYRLAKKNKYRARSVYKLMHIDEEHDIFRDVEGVVDLCAAPGSWSQYASEKLLKRNRGARIVSVDIQDIVPIEGVMCIKDDITSASCLEKILEVLGRPADLVICDGAPDITGIHEIDEYLQIELLKSALATSLRVSRPGSSFVGKYLRGECTPYIAGHFRKFYGGVTLLKPKASRTDSMECFLYCTGMKDTGADPYEIDMAAECVDTPISLCGYGNDPGLEYTVDQNS